MRRHPEAKEKWKDQLQYFQNSYEYGEVFGIDGEPVEFEWNIFPGHTSGNYPRDSDENDSSQNKS